MRPAHGTPRRRPISRSKVSTVEAVAARWVAIEHRRQRGTQHARISTLVAQRDADVARGDPVAPRTRDAFDQPCAPAPSQIVGHATRRPVLHRDAQQRCHLRARLAIIESPRQQPEASNAHSNVCTRAQPKRNAASALAAVGRHLRLLQSRDLRAGPLPVAP